MSHLAPSRGGPRRRLFAAAVTASIVAASSTLLFSGSASAAVAAAPSGIDRVVSLSGTIDSTCGSGIPGGAPVYTSVQAAVNAATAGQQIYVCAGTYTENVNVTTNNIDILGPNWNDPTGASDAATIVAADPGAPVINFTAMSHTDNGVRGLTLSGGTYGVRAQKPAVNGCCWDDASTEGIRNNVITGSTVAAIETNGLNSGLIAGNTITPAPNGDGIRTYDAVSLLNVQSNTIDLSGTGVGITFGGAGEQCCQTIGGASPALGNTITGGQTGILAIDTVPGGFIIDANMIQFNHISDTSGDGIVLSGGILTTHVHDNTIDRSGGSGVRIDNPTSSLAATIQVYRNTITDPAVDGVEVTGNVTDVQVGLLNANGNTITSPGRYGVSMIGTVTTPGDQLTRVLSVGTVYADNNTITDAGSDAIHIVNAELALARYNTISDPNGNGIFGQVLDAGHVQYNTVTGATGDAVHLDDVALGTIFTNTLAGNVGDGIELTNNTSGMVVNYNTITDNAAGVRVTSPTVRASSYIGENDISMNLGYDCEDQSSGVIVNPPAVGSQGNDWNINNGPGSDAVASASPDGICGATLTTDGPLHDGVVGTPYTANVTADGAPGPYTWYSALLPAGLTLNSATGEITGTPTTPVTNRTVYFWVRSAGGVWGRYVDTITDALVANGTFPDPTVGQPYSSPAPTATGGTGPYTWSATGLPPGLTIDPNTGVISGTPTTPGTTTITVTATDSLGATADIVQELNVLPDDPGVPLANPLAVGLALAAAAAVALNRRRVTTA